MINLSPAEREILEVLWKKGGMTNNDVVVYFKERGKDWKRQTTSTFLTRLMQKGVVRKEGHKYAAACTEEELKSRQTREILDTMYGGSLKNFVSSLTRSKKMTVQEIEEIREFLADMEEK